MVIHIQTHPNPNRDKPFGPGNHQMNDADFVQWYFDRWGKFPKGTFYITRPIRIQ